MLEDANWNVSVRKAQPLQQESPRDPNTHLIRAPCLQAVSNVLLDQGKAFTGRFVNVLALLNLLEDPLYSFRSQHPFFEVRTSAMRLPEGTITAYCSQNTVRYREVFPQKLYIQA